MVELFEASIIDFLQEEFFKKFGIDVSFKYSPEMDFLEEFRKDRFLKIKQQETTDYIKDLIGDARNISLAIWNRNPIEKFKDEENGVQAPHLLPFDQLLIETDSGIQLRDIFYGKAEFNIKIFASEAKIINLIEILYNTKFLDVNPPIEIKYSIDGTSYPLDYQTFFNPISSLDYLGIENYGSMRIIEFEFSVYGLFFSPFYFSEKLNTIKEVDLRVFNFKNELTDIDMEYKLNEYNLNNINLNRNLICSETCEVNQKIEEDTCESLNEV